MDWNAMDLPPAPPDGPVLGGYASHKKPARRSSSGIGLVLFALCGGALTVVLLIVGGVMAVAKLSGGGAARAEAAAYLPANWTMAMSLRPAQLIDQIARFPQAKPYLEEALAGAATDRADFRSVTEALIVSEGDNQHFVILFDRDVDQARFFADAAASGEHRGLALYQVTKANRPEAFYFTLPQPRLAVCANRLDRLKAMLDQAANQQPGAADLPSGDHFVLRLRDFSSFARSPLPPPVPWTDLRGLSLNARLSDELSLSVAIDVKDAETAALLERKATQALAAQQQRRQQMAQAAGAELAAIVNERFRIYASGSQLRITGSIPLAQIFDKLPPPGALPGLPAAPQPRPQGFPTPQGIPTPQGPTGIPR